MNPRALKHPLRVGVVGLGVGTLAAYVYLPWHTIRFYEINPEVLRLAETYFTYLADARRARRDGRDRARGRPAVVGAGIEAGIAGL